MEPLTSTVVRATIANIDAPTLARALSPFGINGTIVNSLGFGDWGTEPGVTLETATTDVDDVCNLIADILASRSEQYCYVTFNGARPSLLYPTLATDGHCNGFTLTGL